MFRILVAILVFFGATVSAPAYDGMFQGVNIGGGLSWNDKAPNASDKTHSAVHVSADFRVWNRMGMTPFYEISGRSGPTTALAGLEMKYWQPMFTDGRFYLGPGIGVVDVSESYGNASVLFSGVVGYRHDLTNRFGIFAQGRYGWTDNDAFKGMTAHGGLVFFLKE